MSEVIESGLDVGSWKRLEAEKYFPPQTATTNTIQNGLSLTWVSDMPARVETTPTRLTALAIKRSLDVVMAWSGLMVLSPLLLGVAAAIKLSGPGPALFRQVRIGLHGRRFGMLKFRTMYTDLTDHTGVAQTKPGDSRVTPLGRLLRKTSIDELPQLINVVMGDMSIVGPRPHVPEMLAAGTAYEELVPYYDHRTQMKPGLTGWAQANGLRGPTDDALHARARVHHDLAYIQNFSIVLDLKIIWLTVKREFFGGSGV